MDIDSSQPLTKVPCLWFNDCGLVIRAGPLAFRVSGEILASKSPVFRDMLQFPQPVKAETFEGCPVVYLYDDPADTTLFLRAIFDSEFFEPYPSETDFDTIHGVLLLSGKYLVDYLRRRALGHLSSRFPTELKEWLHPQPASWTLKPEQLIPVINLAREASALWILPAAFYSLCKATPHVFSLIASGVPFRNKTASLYPRDLAVFLEGCYEQREGASAILQFLWHPDHTPHCLSSTRCHAGRYAERKYREGSLYQRGYNPLELWCEEDWLELGPGICRVCVTVMRATHEMALESFWDRLPKMYRLHCWEDLEQMKDAAFVC
ncbi:hypothetical protein FB45DRAFT_1006292 [Roridomyces roridus]|uniref:BTB domain-containing protein n=1 Tax=Roridomyces roridus TaxID=1738132 RepID=A0AAD7BIV3_9AGAR|nr:hypothetical protein FB45DRAFT_1006292 [Roridomyces roridus]